MKYILVQIVLLVLSSSFIFLVAFKESEEERIWELSILKPWNLINSFNYPVENHNITTDDGYILMIQRIPHGKNKNVSIKPPILIVPGLFANSVMWTYEEQGIVYKLADIGYDVWILNNRGITESRGHSYYLPDSKEYWNFSYHEIGIFDVPNTIDYILKFTDYESLYCIGHSQGASALAITLSKLPEYNKKIRLAIHFAPGIYLTHIFGIGKILSVKSIITIFEAYAAKHGYFGLLQNQGHFQVFLANEGCGHPVISRICIAFMQFLMGPNFANLDVKTVRIIASQFPNGASIKQLIHYGQNIHTGEFAEYIENNEWEKPFYKLKLYNISAISVPTAIFYCKNDWITSTQDVERFIKQLPNIVLQHLVEDRYFNHNDFVFGKNRFQMVDDHVIAIMEENLN